MERIILKRIKKNKSETFFIGALLAIVGGFLDAYTYLVRGHVFANAQTGNIVLLGMNFAKAQYKTAFIYLIPVVAFVMGIIIAEVIRNQFQENTNMHWKQRIVALEIFVLLIVMVVPSGAYDTWVNVGISFLCALQVESFRKMNGNAYATTMCTGNLRSATESLFYAIKDKDRNHFLKSIQYYGVIICFILGAVLGTLLIPTFGGMSILFVVALLCIVFLTC